MRLRAQPLDLTLTSPFRIARGVQTTAQNILIEIEDDGLIGRGEAAPNAFYGERRETALAALPYLEARLPASCDLLEDAAQAFDEVFHHGAASIKAAIEMALWDLTGKRLGAPVWRMLGLNPQRAPLTSFTIAIDEPDVMAQRAAAASDYPILKIKVGTGRDIETIRAIRSVSDATLRVDANAAWTPKEAIRAINALAEYNIQFIEQPIPPGDLAGLRLVHQHSPIPIIVDESCVTLQDVPRIAECADGINIKLMKCGGIGAALKMIHAARAQHLQVMIGCMIESSLAISAAAQLAPLIDYADLDGPLLIAADPFTGVQINQGRLLLQPQPGLGVSPTNGATHGA